MTERVLRGAWVREAIPDEQLLCGIAEAFSLAPTEVVPVDRSTDRAAIAVERHLCDGGFRSEVTIYVDPRRVKPPADDLELAIRLARVFGQPAAAGRPQSRDPYAWVLVLPDGRRFAAAEEPSSASGLVLDERPEALEPL
jgi:hypothetical protein